MIYFTEMYASEMIGQTVIDRAEEKIGSVIDVVIEPGDQFPKVIGLLLKFGRGKKEKILLLSEINHIGRRLISANSSKDNIAFASIRENEMLLQRDLMDKQIVDIHGSKVVRVNDLKLAKIGMDIRLIAAEVGFKGIIRRLHLDKILLPLMAVFNIQLKDDLIGWNFVEPLQTDIARLKLVVPYQGVSKLHPADIANIISQVHIDEKTAIFSSLSTETAAEALHELEPRIQAYLIGILDSKKALSIIERMPSDEAADVLGDLPEEKASELLRLMKQKKAEEIQELLKHGEETGGGLMTTEFITISKDLTAQQTIEKIRELAPSCETVYYLYVVDEAQHLVGVLSLRSLIISKLDAPVSEIMKTKIITVHPEMSQKMVAEVISKYNLLAVPVVDKLNRLLGIVTVDDVIDFILPPLARRKRMSVG
ncbi:MAG: CBS domain-containing protein [Candidatus Saganbacteria bacterium]|nr:CBS domain-containing protein [Candidatus Saganbacteria bacterium]